MTEEEIKLEAKTNNFSSKTTSCMRCDTPESEMWHKADGVVLCTPCSMNNKGSYPKNCKRVQPSRKPTVKCNGSTKGSKGRLRNKEKNKALRVPFNEATYTTSNSVYYKGVQYRVGDVVSIQNVDGLLYYASLRSFMEDPYGNQFGVVLWLLPLFPDPSSYNPADFLLGPAEDVPRPLDCMQFVSHDPPPGHITINELKCYDKMLENSPSPFTSKSTGQQTNNHQPPRIHKSGSQSKSNLDILIEALEQHVDNNNVS